MVPQPKVGSISTTSATQITLEGTVSSTNRFLLGVVFQFNETITGTAPGTPRGLSLIFNNVELTDDLGNVSHIDGSTLILSTIDTMRRMPITFQYQAFTEPKPAVSATSYVGQYALMGPFPGTAFKFVLNLNAATASLFTAISAATYTATWTFIEAEYQAIGTKHGKTITYHAQDEHRYRLDGRYVGTTSYWAGLPANKCRHAYVGIDNAELSTKVSSLKVGGVTFSPQQCQMAEDLLGATLPDGMTFGASPFAGNATVPPVNVETGNNLGVAEFGGTLDDVVTLAFTGNVTLLVLQRVAVS